MTFFTDLSDTIEAVGPIVSAVGGMLASNKAAKAQKTSIGDAQERFDTARDRGMAYLDAGYGDAAGVVAPMVAPGDAARNYLQTVMASDPYELTPEQRQVVDDTGRQAMSRVAAGGLRGSGRAQSAIINDAVNRTRDRFFTANQGRADRAASTLETRGASARTNLAQLSTGEAGAKTNLELGVATPQAALERQIGQVNATNIMNQDADLSYGLGASGRVIDQLDSIFNSQSGRDAYPRG